MKITSPALRQFATFFGIMCLALVGVHMFGSDLALAQGAIDPERDQPAVIRLLSGGQTGLRGIVLTIVNFFLMFLGLLAVVMVIYGGFLYVSSAGEEDSVTKAKKILMYTVIGIVIIIVSFALVNTILGAGSTAG